MLLKVYVVITDSPIILSAFYADDQVLGQEFDDLVTKVFKSYDSLNYFIKRVKEYNPVGRFQSESETYQLAEDMQNFLFEHHISYECYKGSREDYDLIVLIILEKLGVK